MSSIANSPTVTTQRIQMPGWMRRAVALGSVCVLLTVILWLRHRPSSDGSVSLASNGASVLSQPTLPLKLPDAWQFREWTTKLDEPLEHEMQLVVNDAKTAMNSLVDNFLPGKLRSSLFERVHD